MAPKILSSKGQSLDPVFSPDGKFIAYSSNLYGDFDIWLVDANGRHKIRLTSMPGDERYPKWSSDGKRIAFLARHVNRTDIWILDIGGSNLINLTDDEACEECFEWHPKNNLILYDSNKNGKWDIYLRNLDTNQMFRLTNSEYDSRYPSWTSDGEGILFSSNNNGTFNIYFMNLGKGLVKQLTRCVHNCTKPSMSSDKAHIAFVLQEVARKTVWIMDSDGKNAREAISSPIEQAPGIGWSALVSDEAYPLWNPKHKMLMYSSSNMDQTGKDIYIFYLNISVIEYSGAAPIRNVVGDALIPIISSRACEIYPNWRPDGKGIIYASNKSGTFDIWLMIIETEKLNPYG
ncbi:MAG: hypothetical protein QW767_06970 [Thermoprotei archaeon]